MSGKLTSTQLNKLARWYDQIAADYRAAAERCRLGGRYAALQLLCAEQADQKARDYRARAHGRRTRSRKGAARA